MVEDSVVENLILIQISCSSSNPSSQNRKLLIFTDFSIENRIKNLVVSDAEVRGFGTAEDDGNVISNDSNNNDNKANLYTAMYRKTQKELAIKALNQVI